MIPRGRRPAKRTAARCRGFACSMLPGFHPGLFVWMPGLEGRVDSNRAAARQANRGTMPRVRVHHAPGFPPGASWTDDETDSRCKGPAKRRSQPDSCSGDALSSHSAQHRNPQAEPALLRGPGLLPDHHAARRTLHPPHAAAKRQPIQRPCCCQVGATAQKTFSPSYALGSVKLGIHVNPGSKSSLHLRGAVEPPEPPGKCQPEPVQ